MSDSPNPTDADPNAVGDASLVPDDENLVLDEASSDADEANVVPDDASPATSEVEQSPEPAPRRPTGPKRPWFDIYTAMLGISVLALAIACLFMWIELYRYDFQMKPPATLLETSTSTP